MRRSSSLVKPHSVETRVELLLNLGKKYKQKLKQ